MNKTPFEAYQQFVLNHTSKGLGRVLPKDPSSAMIDFTSNDSLQLSKHPAIIEASANYLQTFGASVSGARLLTKQQALFTPIEKKLASLKQTETALLFASGFQANLSTIAAILDKSILKHSPLVFADKLVHASIHQGIQLAGAKQIRFHHQDLNHLEQRLQAYSNDKRHKFIFVESLYGMQGSLTNIEACAKIAKKHHAFLYVDEAHAFGLYGPQGYGLTSGVHGVDVSMGNFSKALGSFGGFIACSHQLRDYLMNRAAGFIYSTALPPALLGAQKAALLQLAFMDEQREKLKSLARYFKAKLQTYMFKMTSSDSHIFGLLFNDIEVASNCYQHLYHNHIMVSLIRPPTVPKPLLRISLNSSHNKEQIDMLLERLKETQSV